MKGGGRPPKNAIWFELAIASLLQTESRAFGERHLDLRSFYFDVNPRAYPRNLTRTGSADIDIVAQEGDVRYNISCKFSQKDDSVMELRSTTFLSVFLQFLPAFGVGRYLGQRMEFVLATNMRLGQSVSDLLAKRPPGLVRDVAASIRRLTSNKPEATFHRQLFSYSAVDNLARTIVPLQVTIGELERRYDQSDAYRTAFARFSKNLVRTPEKGLNLLGLAQPDMALNCMANESRNHKMCIDVVIDNALCHIGNIRKIRDLLKSRGTELLTSSESIAVIEDGRIVKIRETALEGTRFSEPRICFLLSKILNDKRIVDLPQKIAVVVMVGARNILILDGSKLAPKLKATSDEMFRFHPNSLQEIRELRLGDETLREITKLCLSVGLQLSVSDADIITNSQLLGEKRDNEGPSKG